MDFILDILLDTLLDTVKLVPFLLLTFFLLALLEKKAGTRVNDTLSRAGRMGPVVGGLLGMIPQCGFSAAASSFYAGRVISVGTLIAVYLSTSDEMLPILISCQAPVTLMLKLLLLKAGIGIFVGLILDCFFIPKKSMRRSRVNIQCQSGFCACRQGVVKSTLWHTLQVVGYIFLFSFALGFLLHYVSLETIATFMGDRVILGPLVAAAVGLIPNCASSVVLTTMYLEGALGLGAMLAGLLTNAGVGVLVLFRVNQNRRKENLCILGGLYGIGVVSGVIINLIAGML